MSIEQLWRYASGIGFLTLMIYTYLDVRRRVARGGSFYLETEYTDVKFPRIIQRFIRWFNATCGPKVRPWMIIPGIVVGFVMLINTIVRA